MSDKSPKLRPHVIDGIQEYDNKLPGWWVALFWFTIVFGVVYLVKVHVMDGNLIYDELSADRAATSATMNANNAPKSADDLKAVLADPARIAEGKELYMANCAACHKADGGGLVGPNLTDNAWIHGGSAKDIIYSIDKGIPSKGMIAWGPILGPKKIESITGFILSIQGTNPPGAKAAEGAPHVAK